MDSGAWCDRYKIGGRECSCCYIRALFGALIEDEPLPEPLEVVERLAMQAWVEALRRPHLRQRVDEYHRTVAGDLFGGVVALGRGADSPRS